MKKLEKKLLDSKTSQDHFAYYAQGDCKECSQQYLPPSCIDLIITDPPYGIDGHKLHRHYNRDESFVLDGYVEIPKDQYREFSQSWICEAERVLKPGGSFYLVSGWTNLRDILNVIAEETHLELVNHVIWKYNFGVFTQNKYVSSHYHILYLVKPGAKPVFNTYARFSPKEKTENQGSVLYQDMEDVWDIKREYKKGKTRHKNELPTTLLAKIIQYSSNEGDCVADFFAGSFSTAKVAKGLNRSSVSFEISPEACKHQVPLVDRMEWGSMLDQVPIGQDDRPKNQKQPWTESDLDQLEKAYQEYRRQGMGKKEAIAHLQTDFERGFFSILNALKKIQSQDEKELLWSEEK